MSVPKFSPKKIEYSFFNLYLFSFSSVPEFVHSIAAQMSQSPAMKSYYQLVMSDNRIRSRLAIPSCTSDPDGSFVQGILDPLKTLQGQGSLGSNQCIILVDGLEESEEHRPGKIIRVFWLL